MKAIVVINAGSSSLKFSVFAVTDLSLLLHGQVEGLGTQPHLEIKGGGGQVLCAQQWTLAQVPDHEVALDQVLQALPPYMAGHTIQAVGHRIVHGGMSFHEPVRLTPPTLDALDALVPLAPLHQSHNLSAVRAFAKLMPHLPQVGCFDTAFHTTNPAVEARFALPFELHDAGVRRYGFHGLSYEYIASCLPAVDARAAKGRTVAMHLGNGASMCALQSGRSVASSMGFTALDGLMMGTRCGDLDPGVLIWLMDQRAMGARQIEHLLYSESGLKGVSGLSSDMRVLLDSEAPRAQEAVELFVYRITRELGAMAAVLSGLDAIVFTAGIGEYAAVIRERVCQQAAWLGVVCDAQASPAGSDPASPTGALGAWRLDAPGSAVSVWVIPTNEELMIARHTRDLIWPHQRKPA